MPAQSFQGTDLETTTVVQERSCRDLGTVSVAQTVLSAEWGSTAASRAGCMPVRKIAETRKQSAATGILYSLALGYPSCIIPVIR